VPQLKSHVFKKNLNPKIDQSFDFVVPTAAVASSVVHIVCWDDDLLSNGSNQGRVLFVLNTRTADVIGEAFVALADSSPTGVSRSRIVILRGTGPIGLARAIEQMIDQREDKVADAFISDRKKCK
jgi:hypothetical protein